MQVQRTFLHESAIRAAMFIIFLIPGVAGLTTPAYAQSSSSSVNGVITDPVNAVVAGAKVVLHNVDTNVERITISNSAGDYIFPSVPPARYTLTFSAKGFQNETISTFSVAVAQVVTLNASLRVGDVTQSVTVEATGAQVESSNAQLGTVMGTKEINDLPLNGRNFTQLLTLTPGATPISVGQNNSPANTASNANVTPTFPSINGQSNRSTFYLVDGLNDTNNWYNTYGVPPIIDMMQEFKVTSHGDAEYGSVTGGVVNIASKAGTNSLHGTVWEFLRNNAVDAETYFPSASSLYHINQFGAQVGGPVVIPHLYHGRDKTFFEVGFESFRSSVSAQKYYLQPTAAQLGESTWGGSQDLGYGDFSSATTGVAGCTSTATTATTAKCQLYDPTGNHNSTSNRPAYIGNKIPVSEMDPHAVAYLNAIYGPPTVLAGIAPTTYNGQVLTPTQQTTYNYSGRIDQHIGDKDFIFFRYAGWQEYNTGTGGIPHLFSDSTLPAQQYGINWTHIFSPSLSMQVQYGRLHVEYNTTTLFNIPGIANTYGMDPSFAQSYIGNITVMPNLSMSGYGSGGETNSPAPNEANTHEWQGSVTKIIGRHTIQAGGGWDQINYGETIRTSTVTFSGQPTANFTGNPGSPAGITAAQISAQSGNALATLLLDEPTAATKRNVLLTERPGGIGNIYLQDSWKATPKLTVNVGLRYDRTAIPQYGTDASIGNQGSIETGDFDFNTGNYILQVTPPLCSVRGHAPCLPFTTPTLPNHVVVALNQKILHGSKMNLGPRLGLAYRVNDTLAIRGGFGITYDNWAASIQLPQNFQGSWPDIGTLGVSNLNQQGATALTSAQNPFGTTSGIYPAASPFTSSNVNYFVDPSIKNPYSEQWNLGIEQQFGRNTIWSLNYVGSESHRLDLGGYYNTGTLSTTSFTTRQNQYNANPTTNPTGQLYPYTVPNKWDHPGGNGTYNALQMSLTRSSSNGLTYNAAYTWSKSIDEGTSGFFGVEGFSLEDPYNPRGSRSVSAYNVPQLLTLGLTYDLPVGKNRAYSTGNNVADYILGNWEIGTIFIMRSGQNFNVTSSGDIGNTGNGNTYERANLIGNPLLPNRTQNEWFNTAAFVTPNQGTLGNFGRNGLMDQTYYQLDASVFRLFPIAEALRFQLRFDAFNALNHPVLGTPGSSTTTPSTFGVITSTANSQRLLQISGKFIF
jgi:hypothetical protein